MVFYKFVAGNYGRVKIMDCWESFLFLINEAVNKVLKLIAKRLLVRMARLKNKGCYHDKQSTPKHKMTRKAF